MISLAEAHNNGLITWSTFEVKRKSNILLCTKSQMHRVRYIGTLAFRLRCYNHRPADEHQYAQRRRISLRICKPSLHMYFALVDAGSHIYRSFHLF